MCYYFLNNFAVASFLIGGEHSSNIGRMFKSVLSPCRIFAAVFAVASFLIGSESRSSNVGGTVSVSGKLLIKAPLF
jgi:hypothetical protein